MEFSSHQPFTVRVYAHRAAPRQAAIAAAAVGTEKGSVCKGVGVAVTLGPGDHRSHHNLLLLAQPSRLQKLVFRSRYQARLPTQETPVLRAVGRFTAQTELYLCSLMLKEITLQVTALNDYLV